MGRLRRWPHWGKTILGLLVVFVAYVIYLDTVIRVNFEGKRWALPAHVYARPMELYPGLRLSPAQFNLELTRLGYRYAYQPGAQGTYSREGDRFLVVTRHFQFWDGAEPSRKLELRFDEGYLQDLQEVEQDKELTLARLEPSHIGGIYPAHNEDRILIQLKDTPPLLAKALVTVEDRNFYTHIGMDPRAIARAIWVNLTGSGGLQGGSTLTQQLVKNFFLSNERTLSRKFNEAIMALLLEWHYEKDEILEAYLNEVYLGQDAQRAVHGFGLASRFYFDKPVDRLELHEIAVLVAMIRGPGYYHPYRHAARLLERRNLVLELMFKQGVITQVQFQAARRAGLGVIQDRPGGGSSYPAFMDLVRRQLREDYRESDLTSEGLRIFTTFDPFVQQSVEESVVNQVKALDRQRGLKGQLQAAVVVTDPSNGEVLAMLGDRTPGYAGFNRVLDAQRPVGSLLKPAVYLTAIEKSRDYNPLTLIDDTSITLKGQGGSLWTPKNYDNEAHGQVPLYQALVNSYNLATVRLGMKLGFEDIERTLHRLGIKRSIPPYPSMMLGAVDLSPMEIAQMYQTLASGGFRTPLRAIREVMTADGKPLQRYPINIEQTVDGKAVAVLSSVMQEIMRTGTGQAVRQFFPADAVLAGKTGTTDDLRDSWFAGFGSDYLGIVWLGTDDNQPIHLTGGSGALRVWGDMMRRLQVQSLLPIAIEGVESLPIEPQSLLVGGDGCGETVELAFIKGTAPDRYAPCAGGGPRQDTND